MLSIDVLLVVVLDSKGVNLLNRYLHGERDCYPFDLCGQLTSTCKAAYIDDMIFYFSAPMHSHPSTRAPTPPLSDSSDDEPSMYTSSSDTSYI